MDGTIVNGMRKGRKEKHIKEKKEKKNERKRKTKKKSKLFKNFFEREAYIHGALYSSYSFF